MLAPVPSNYTITHSSYVGQWARGLRHGQGACTGADGSVYEGAWEQGRREGHGVLTRRVAAKARRRPGQPHEDDEDDEDDEDGDEALRVGEGAGGAEGRALAAAGGGEGEGPLSSEGGVEVYEGQWQNDMQVGEPKG